MVGHAVRLHQLVDACEMFRGAIALLAFAVSATMLSIPLLLLSLVYPSRRAYSWSTAFCARLTLAICGVRLTVEGSEVLRDDAPKFFVGNHQSVMDISILLVMLSGRVRFIAKDSLFRIPFFGWALARYGNVAINRARPRVARERLNRMLGSLARRPISFVMFPEGTRSKDGTLLPFRKGAMRICRRSGLPIVPVSIDGSGVVCPRDQYRVHPGPVRLRFGEPIPADEVASMSPAVFHDRVRQTVAEGLGQVGDVVPRP